MKKLLIALLVVACVCSVLLIACTVVVLEAEPDVEDKIIIERACREMDISPKHTAITQLSVEYVPWLKCDVYNYALEADAAVYVVGVKKIGEKVIDVDVIEQVESIYVARENYTPQPENG